MYEADILLAPFLIRLTHYVLVELVLFGLLILAAVLLKGSIQYFTHKCYLWNWG